MTQVWNGYNNVGLCATALSSVIEHTGKLSLSKAMLVMPLVMHDATISFLSNRNIRKREAAALASVRPELIVNFNSRFEDSLVASLNAIQLLVHLGYARLGVDLIPVKPMQIDDVFGKRVQRIVKATPNIAALLDSSVDELYLNFRIQL